MIQIYKLRALKLVQNQSPGECGESAGGVVICAGSFFHDCRVQSCETYVVHGASVVFASCTWLACGMALNASGPGTGVAVEDCSFEACKLCMLTEAGATNMTESCSLGAAHVGAVSHNPGSHFALEKSSIALMVVVRPCSAAACACLAATRRSAAAASPTWPQESPHLFPGLPWSSPPTVLMPRLMHACCGAAPGRR